MSFFLNAIFLTCGAECRLKGGLLLAKYIPIGRETQDLDLLGVGTPNDKEHLRKTFSDIARIDLRDGFVFKDVDVTELEHLHPEFPEKL